MQSWSLGIICFNEKETIKHVFEDAKALLEKMTDDFEIIMVDDASTDGSTEIIKSIADENDVCKPFYHEANKGIGASIRDVYFNATKENLGFIPGDGQFDVLELQPFGEFDSLNFICFFRKENQSYSFFRNVLSYYNKLFNKIFLGFDLKDVNWVKIYKRKVVQSLDLKMQSSIIESEICAKLSILGFKPIEVESKYMPRVYGESKGASFTNMRRVLIELIGLSWNISKFRMKNLSKKVNKNA